MDPVRYFGFRDPLKKPCVFKEVPPEHPELMPPRRDLATPPISADEIMNWAWGASPDARRLLALTLIADVSDDLDAVAFAEKLAERGIIRWPYEEFSVSASDIDGWLEDLRKGNDDAVGQPYTPPPPGMPF